MKIQASNASQIYKSFASAPKTVKGGKPEAAKSAVSNMDKIELSGEFSPLGEKFTIVGGISAEVSADTAIDRLAGLRDMIADGSYDISSSSIADAILFGNGNIAEE